MGVWESRRYFYSHTPTPPHSHTPTRPYAHTDTQMRSFNSLAGLLFLLPLLFLAVFYLYPLAAILSYSLFPGGALDLAGLNTLIADP